MYLSLVSMSSILWETRATQFATIVYSPTFCLAYLSAKIITPIHLLTDNNGNITIGSFLKYASFKNDTSSAKIGC